MPWLYIIIFLLISTGLLSLFGVHVTDLLTIFSKSKSVTLSDELKVVMGIPVKGFFNREYELGEMLRSMGRAEMCIRDRPEPEAPASSGPAPGSTNNNGEFYDPVFGWVKPGTVQQQEIDNEGDPNKMVGNMG